MPDLNTVVPASLVSALHAEATRTGATASTVVTAALAQYLGTPIHTLFQVSTSGALVAGISSGVVSVKSILEHGDFGLGTFANLDGEMVVLEGRAYQVQGSGKVSESAPDAAAPFAVVTRFDPEVDVRTAPIASIAALGKCCDEHRSSNNIFYAIRLDGHFDRIRTRLARRIASPLGHIAVLATRRMEVVQIEPDGVPVFATQKSFRRRYRCGDTNIKCRPVRQKSSRQLSGRSRRASKSKRRQRC
jgi:acetolactate decarboxylase